MLEYVSGLWQTFLHRPDFWAVLSIIPVTAFCHMGTCVDGFKNGILPN